MMIIPLLLFHYYDHDDNDKMIEWCNQDGNVGKPDNACDPPSNPSRTSWCWCGYDDDDEDDDDDDDDDDE